MNRRFSTSAVAVVTAFFAVLVFWVLPMTAHAQKTLLNHTYKKAGNTRVKVESVFDTVSSKGYMPVRVTIRNGTRDARKWSLAFSTSSGYNGFKTQSSFTVSADANSEAIHELLIPLPTSFRGNTYSSYVITVNSPGLSLASTNVSNRTNVEWPSIGISKALAQRSITQLNDKMRNSGSFGSEIFAGTFDPKMLPGDWRGYSGLDVLMIQDKEWDTVPAGPRKAILRWIRQGGVLDVYTDQQARLSAGVGYENADSVINGRHKFSLGYVNVKKWDGKELPVSSTLSHYKKIVNQVKQFAEGFNSWKLQRLFGKGSESFWLVIILLLVFAIVVGPVNLFVFAKPGHRQKLFITTPLISLITSGLIFGFIIVKDGIGGTGQRITFANLQSGSEEKQMYLRQEQISRTGVLLSSGFTVDESAFITPVRMKPSTLNRLTDGRNRSRGTFIRKGDAYNGDWFQSRSEQGQAVFAVRPTRSRIELRAPASADGSSPPKLFSSLEFNLGEFYYRDKNGNVWKSTSAKISPGNEIPLEASDAKALHAWWVKQTDVFSATFRKSVRRLENTRGHFFAITTDPQAGSLDSLKSIRWENDLVVMCGGVLTEITSTTGTEIK